MTEAAPVRWLPRLRWYLLAWLASCALLMVIAYTQLLEYYLELGIDLRTKSFLERTATEYARESISGADPALPTGRSLSGYLAVADIPAGIRAVFPFDERQHGEMLRHVNLDIDDDDPSLPIDTLNLCPESSCELLFLYSYQLDGGEWLFLLHGVVGSDAIYDELELTEQAAFVIGSLFTGLFLLVSFLGIRSIDGPLRRLERWSADLSTENSDVKLPDLRFRELDTLANRLRFAFERMREGVEKEKLFLRHASHELRTPIAILSSNVELLDRLTDRPERSEPERAALIRQYRALEDIRLLMETLLWINRQSDNLPKAERIDLRSEVDTIVENYRYLLDARAVSLTVEGGGEAISAPAAAVRIVLSNLLRNAFQYTVDGEVLVSIGAGQVSIENSSSTDLDTDDAAHLDDEYGFGLGLELVSLICRRFEWRSTTTELPRGRVSIVRF
jgi:signal transduction histidine kinase